MARIFRHAYTKNGVRKPTRKWYIEYRDADGIRQRVAGFVDKAATRQRAAELEREAERRASGLIDRFADHRKRPLAEHLGDWEKSLLDNGDTPEYVRKTVNRTRRVFDECGFDYWHEISASKVESCLAQQREREHVSIQTSNYYLRAVKQFCRWMEQDGRAPSNPVKHLKGGNPRTDRRHDRRAFTDEELRRLITMTRNGPTWRHVPGPERAIVYRLSVETGLRANEIRSLTVGSFALESSTPTVTVGAAYSKSRREDVLPLRPELVRALKAHFEGKSTVAKAFAMPKSESDVVRILRKDLTAGGIEYRDESGRVLDFHALRHTFISNLARGGVHPKVAQELARHSTITLTMDRYSHTVLEDLSAALNQLPGWDSGRPEGTKRQEPVAGKKLGA